MRSISSTDCDGARATGWTDLSSDRSVVTATKSSYPRSAICAGVLPGCGATVDPGSTMKHISKYAMQSYVFAADTDGTETPKTRLSTTCTKQQGAVLPGNLRRGAR